MDEIIAFADESGNTAGCPCYTIGILTIPTHYLDEFDSQLKGMIAKSGIRGELKWQKIRKSAGKLNLCIGIAKLVLESPCSFHCIVVRKDFYRKWQIDEEEAFFTTYDYLLANTLKNKNSRTTVKIDQKSTSYAKQDEVVKIISNHIIRKKTGRAKIEKLSMEDSKQHLGLQAVDILTGAVNTGHWLFMDKNAQIDLAKKIACKRIAMTLGWKKLVHDTMPNDEFNIWHFPQEYRSTPSTEKVAINLEVPTVSREEYEYWAKIYS
ncbi:DUF3800 domain-containing protein [Vibrio salinus]|uniref:DUF3800 domain-containing protein n=1 Tax=Vibrio salinus TaxID=2899784 RepID=UPI001E64C766|nr:DUF3800 domain-containing protein [Vibrio salinus]MCE0493898.1 DUF3800 domain-containing protein [Vibrio salinus]